MTATIAVMNQKGGVGKTTLSDEIIYELESRGKTVAFTNMDPQGGAKHEPTMCTGEEDYLVIDTPGHMTRDFANVAKTATVIVIPTIPDSQNTMALERSYKIAKTANPKAKIGVVLNCYAGNRLVDKDFESYVGAKGYPIWAKIPKTTEIDQAHQMYMGLRELNDSNRAVGLIAALVDRIEKEA